MTMKENKVLKILSYILLPIFIAIIIVSVIYTFTKASYKSNMDNYFGTTSFTADYMKLLSTMARVTIYTDNDNSYIEDGKYKIYYSDINDYNYNTRLKDNYILIIYGGKAITNVNVQDINTIDDIIKYIEEQERRENEYSKRKSRKNISCSEI